MKNYLFISIYKNFFMRNVKRELKKKYNKLKIL